MLEFPIPSAHSILRSGNRSKIAEAIEEYRKKTCIEFSPKSAADQDYIHIVPDDGCYSLVGRIVGFFHEQSRADRDEYVIINWSNVEAGLQDQFDKYSLNMIDHLGSTYDYGSVMHYAPTAFSKNGMPTIEPKEKGIEIGQRKGFSDNDLYKINKLYNCPQIETEESESDVIVNSSHELVTVRLDSASNSWQKIVHLVATHAKRFWKKNQTVKIQDCAKILNIILRSWCERWATSGMCTQPIFQDYMKNKCAKSCQLC
uniref:Metalloendopeptidase n=1 Tax=Heterorhabditis bacteriophora TaxID=37862 RepID=A0A1I7WU74_HETBA